MPVTKEQIADAFEKRVERFGFAKTTLDELAHDLGISKKTIYTQFDSKADIYGYIVSRLARESRLQLQSAVSGLPTFGEKLTQVVRLVVGMARTHVRETDRSEWEAEYVVAEDAFTEAIGALVAEILAGGIAAGEFAVRDASFATRMLTAMLIEYTLMMRDDPALDRDEEFVAAARRFAG